MAGTPPRFARFASQNASSSSSSNIAEFIYKGANKHHWAKLQSKIKQRLIMAENISYIDDEEEVARRSMPPVSLATSIP
jgi:hypothetical protein